MLGKVHFCGAILCVDLIGIIRDSRRLPVITHIVVDKNTRIRASQQQHESEQRIIISKT
jgi:uncharacterized protein (DUF2235 family)